ncbi:MAG: AsnC family protein [Acidianus sp.]|nr:AsnC family protein [Acidianus sp.]
MLIEKEHLKLSEVLYYLQRFGDLNPRVIGAISRIKDADKLIQWLRENFQYRLYPIPRYEALGLKKYYVTIYSNYADISLYNIYELFDGMTSFILRDVINPLVLNLSIYYNSTDFDRVLDYLQDEGIIYHYDLHKVEEEKFYPIEYSNFNFERREFTGLLTSPREPFELPDLTEGFFPDEVDMKIIGKKQEKTVSSLKDISTMLGISFKDALYHTQAHVIGKGLIKGYSVYLYKPDFRLEISFSEKETLEELSRIPSMYLAYKLDDKTYYAHVFDNSSRLLDYLDFISSLKSKDTIEVYIHPFNEKYLFTASIPYEHFENGRWNFNTEVMMFRVEKLVKKIEEKDGGRQGE